MRGCQAADYSPGREEFHWLTKAGMFTLLCRWNKKRKRYEAFWIHRGSKAAKHFELISTRENKRSSPNILFDFTAATLLYLKNNPPPILLEELC